MNSEISQEFHEIFFKQFAIKAQENFLGISVVRQKLYVVQKKSISVFQYFGVQNHSENVRNDKLYAPTLVKEIFLPFEISRFIITQKYICIKSKNQTQIRDIDFQTVYLSENVGFLTIRKNEASDPMEKDSVNSVANNINTHIESEQELELSSQIHQDQLIIWKVIARRYSNRTNGYYEREFRAQNLNILSKRRSFIKFVNQKIDPTQKKRPKQIYKAPIFVNQLGYIQNFYIWPFSSNDIQLGIYFNKKMEQDVIQNATFQICSFQINGNFSIKQIYYYDFDGRKIKKQENPQLLLIVGQSLESKNACIKLLIFELLPEQKVSESFQHKSSALDRYMDQFIQLSKQKQAQQSVSPNVLLNEILSEKKSLQGQNSGQAPTKLLQSLTLNKSSKYRKSFFNSQTKILWIDDESNLSFKIQLAKSESYEEIKKEGFSFVEKIQQYCNKKQNQQLESVMYDNYPVYKVPTVGLQIGIMTKPNVSNEVKQTLQREEDRERDVLQVDQEELNECVPSKLNESNRINTATQLGRQNTQNLQALQKSIHQVQQKCDQQTQTGQHQVEEKQQNNPLVIQFQHQDINELLKKLDFPKFQDSLIRFSTLIAANLNKSITKLKESNQKAKAQISLKMNTEIFDMITQIFQPALGEILEKKIEEKVKEAVNFVEKIFEKHTENFHLILMQDNIKEEQAKRNILQEQIRSVQVIKQASVKFLDVSKVREMQKIAYNEIIVEQIKEVGAKIERLQQSVNKITNESRLIQNSIITNIKEIKETFELLAQESGTSSSESSSQSDKSERQSSASQSQDISEEEESQDEVYASKGYHPAYYHPGPGAVQGQFYNLPYDSIPPNMRPSEMGYSHMYPPQFPPQFWPSSPFNYTPAYQKGSSLSPNNYHPQSHLHYPVRPEPQVHIKKKQKKKSLKKEKKS